MPGKVGVVDNAGVFSRLQDKSQVTGNLTPNTLYGAFPVNAERGFMHDIYGLTRGVSDRIRYFGAKNWRTRGRSLHDLDKYLESSQPAYAVRAGYVDPNSGRISEHNKLAAVNLYPYPSVAGDLPVNLFNSRDEAVGKYSDKAAANKYAVTVTPEVKAVIDTNKRKADITLSSKGIYDGEKLAITKKQGEFLLSDEYTFDKSRIKISGITYHDSPTPELVSGGWYFQGVDENREEKKTFIKNGPTDPDFDFAPFLHANIDTKTWWLKKEYDTRAVDDVDLELTCTPGSPVDTLVNGGWLFRGLDENGEVKTAHIKIGPADPKFDFLPFLQANTQTKTWWLLKEYDERVTEDTDLELTCIYGQPSSDLINGGWHFYGLDKNGEEKSVYVKHGPGDPNFDFTSYLSANTTTNTWWLLKGHSDKATEDIDLGLTCTYGKPSENMTNGGWVFVGLDKNGKEKRTQVKIGPTNPNFDFTPFLYANTNTNTWWLDKGYDSRVTNYIDLELTCIFGTPDKEMVNGGWSFQGLDENGSEKQTYVRVGPADPNFNFKPFLRANTDTKTWWLLKGYAEKATHDIDLGLTCTYGKPVKNMVNGGWTFYGLDENGREKKTHIKVGPTESNFDFTPYLQANITTKTWWLLKEYSDKATNDIDLELACTYGKPKDNMASGGWYFSGLDENNEPKKTYVKVGPIDPDFDFTPFLKANTTTKTWWLVSGYSDKVTKDVDLGLTCTYGNPTKVMVIGAWSFSGLDENGNGKTARIEEGPPDPNFDFTPFLKANTTTQTWWLLRGFFSRATEDVDLGLACTYGKPDRDLVNGGWYFHGLDENGAAKTAYVKTGPTDPNFDFLPFIQSNTTTRTWWLKKEYSDRVTEDIDLGLACTYGAPVNEVMHGTWEFEGFGGKVATVTPGPGNPNFDFTNFLQFRPSTNTWWLLKGHINSVKEDVDLGLTGSLGRPSRDLVNGGWNFYGMDESRQEKTTYVSIGPIDSNFDFTPFLRPNTTTNTWWLKKEYDNRATKDINLGLTCSAGRPTMSMERGGWYFHGIDEHNNAKQTYVRVGPTDPNFDFTEFLHADLSTNTWWLLHGHAERATEDIDLGLACTLGTPSSEITAGGWYLYGVDMEGKAKTAHVPIGPSDPNFTFAPFLQANTETNTWWLKKEYDSRATEDIDLGLSYITGDPDRDVAYAGWYFQGLDENGGVKKTYISFGPSDYDFDFTPFLRADLTTNTWWLMRGYSDKAVNDIDLGLVCSPGRPQLDLVRGGWYFYGIDEERNSKSTYVKVGPTDPTFDFTEFLQANSKTNTWWLLKGHAKKATKDIDLGLTCSLGQPGATVVNGGWYLHGSDENGEAKQTYIRKGSTDPNFDFGYFLRPNIDTNTWWLNHEYDERVDEDINLGLTCVYGEPVGVLSNGSWSFSGLDDTGNVKRARIKFGSADPNFDFGSFLYSNTTTNTWWLKKEYDERVNADINLGLTCAFGIPTMERVSDGWVAHGVDTDGVSKQTSIIMDGPADPEFDFTEFLQVNQDTNTWWLLKEYDLAATDDIDLGLSHIVGNPDIALLHSGWHFYGVDEGGEEKRTYLKKGPANSEFDFAPYLKGNLTTNTWWLLHGYSDSIEDIDLGLTYSNHKPTADLVNGGWSFQGNDENGDVKSSRVRFGSADAEFDFTPFLQVSEDTNTWWLKKEYDNRVTEDIDLGLTNLIWKPNADLVSGGWVARGLNGYGTAKKIRVKEGPADAEFDFTPFLITNSDTNTWWLKKEYKDGVTEDIDLGLVVVLWKPRADITNGVWSFRGIDKNNVAKETFVEYGPLNTLFDFKNYLQANPDTGTWWLLSGYSAMATSDMDLGIAYKINRITKKNGYGIWKLTGTHDTGDEKTVHIEQAPINNNFDFTPFLYANPETNTWWLKKEYSNNVANDIDLGLTHILRCPGTALNGGGWSFYGTTVSGDTKKTYVRHGPADPDFDFSPFLYINPDTNTWWLLKGHSDKAIEDMDLGLTHAIWKPTMGLVNGGWSFHGNDENGDVKNALVKVGPINSNFDFTQYLQANTDTNTWWLVQEYDDRVTASIDLGLTYVLKNIDKRMVSARRRFYGVDVDGIKKQAVVANSPADPDFDFTPFLLPNTTTNTWWLQKEFFAGATKDVNLGLTYIINKPTNTLTNGGWYFNGVDDNGEAKRAYVRVGSIDPNFDFLPFLQPNTTTNTYWLKKSYDERATKDIDLGLTYIIKSPDKAVVNGRWRFYGTNENGYEAIKNIVVGPEDPNFDFDAFLYPSTETNTWWLRRGYVASATKAVDLGLTYIIKAPTTALVNGRWTFVGTDENGSAKSAFIAAGPSSFNFDFTPFLRVNIDTNTWWLKKEYDNRADEDIDLGLTYVIKSPGRALTNGGWYFSGVNENGEEKKIYVKAGPVDPDFDFTSFLQVNEDTNTWWLKKEYLDKAAKDIDLGLTYIVKDPVDTLINGGWYFHGVDDSGAPKKTYIKVGSIDPEFDFTPFLRFDEDTNTWWLRKEYDDRVMEDINLELTYIVKKPSNTLSNGGWDFYGTDEDGKEKMASIKIGPSNSNFDFTQYLQANTDTNTWWLKKEYDDRTAEDVDLGLTYIVKRPTEDIARGGWYFSGVNENGREKITYVPVGPTDPNFDFTKFLQANPDTNTWWLLKGHANRATEDVNLGLTYVINKPSKDLVNGGWSFHGLDKNGEERHTFVKIGPIDSDFDFIPFLQVNSETNTWWLLKEYSDRVKEDIDLGLAHILWNPVADLANGGWYFYGVDNNAEEEQIYVDIGPTASEFDFSRYLKADPDTNTWWLMKEYDNRVTEDIDMGLVYRTGTPVVENSGLVLGGSDVIDGANDSKLFVEGLKKYNADTKEYDGLELEDYLELFNESLTPELASKLAVVVRNRVGSSIELEIGESISFYTSDETDKRVEERLFCDKDEFGYLQASSEGYRHMEVKSDVFPDYAAIATIYAKGEGMWGNNLEITIRQKPYAFVTVPGGDYSVNYEKRSNGTGLPVLYRDTEDNDKWVAHNNPDKNTPEKFFSRFEEEDGLRIFELIVEDTLTGINEYYPNVSFNPHDVDGSGLSIYIKNVLANSNLVSIVVNENIEDYPYSVPVDRENIEILPVRPNPNEKERTVAPYVFSETARLSGGTEFNLNDKAIPADSGIPGNIETVRSVAFQQALQIILDKWLTHDSYIAFNAGQEILNPDFANLIASSNGGQPRVLGLTAVPLNQATAQDVLPADIPKDEGGPSGGVATPWVAKYNQWILGTDSDAGQQIYTSPVGWIGKLIGLNAVAGMLPYAPAGYRRGILQGAYGLSRSWEAKQRLGVVEYCWNPIKYDPSAGYVVWDALTSQPIKSALSNIHVILAYQVMRRGIEQTLKGFEFEFNDESTVKTMLNMLRSAAGTYVSQKYAEQIIVDAAENEYGTDQIRLRWNVRFKEVARTIVIDINAYPSSQDLAVSMAG